MKVIAKVLVSIILATAATSTALGQYKHPNDIAMIDEALKTAKITKSERAQVIKLRNEGYNFHYKTGEMDKAEIVLEKAKSILHLN